MTSSPPRSSSNSSIEAQTRTQAKILLDLISQHSAQSHLFEAKQAAIERQRELDGLEKERLTLRVETLRREREPELASLLVLAGTVNHERARDKRISQLEMQCEMVRLDLTNAQSEADNLRERLREAQISATRANLHAQQLAEEVSRAKAEAAKAVSCKPSSSTLLMKNTN